MDEPTNDLDVETLELLEEMLADYTGTLLLVSHDRDFLDNVVTSTLVMEGDGRVGEYVGGYTDWLRQRPAPVTVAAAKPAKAKEAQAEAAPVVAAPATAARRKLSYKDARELEQLPARIESLEAELASLAAAMSDAGFYQQDPGAVAAHTRRMAEAQDELDTAYARWSELDG
jgi:ATP-binding cassette subfamily F protein uup